MQGVPISCLPGAGLLGGAQTQVNEEAKEQCAMGGLEERSLQCSTLPLNKTKKSVSSLHVFTVNFTNEAS